MQRYLDLMGHDKKVEGGRVRFVVLQDLGHALVTSEVPRETLASVLSEASAPAHA